jgi:hypothetical protein
MKLQRCVLHHNLVAYANHLKSLFHQAPQMKPYVDQKHHSVIWYPNF